MHILYIDESAGSDENKYFILAGVSIFECQTYSVAQKLDRIAKRFNPREPQKVELHGSPMLTGKGIWRQIDRDLRPQAIKDALQILDDSGDSRVFAVGVKPNEIDGKPIEFAFLQLVSLFDQYLNKVVRHDDKQRGMILFDKSVHERPLQSLTTLYRDQRHERGQIKYLSEVPAFIDSQVSRLIQLADLIAYAVGRKVNQDDSRFFDVIKPYFDHDKEKMHELCFFPPLEEENNNTSANIAVKN